MESTKKDMGLVDDYFSALKNLNDLQKLELISKLTDSIKYSKLGSNNDVSLHSLYGSWASEKSADELIEEIKDARSFNRNREDL